MNMQGIKILIAAVVAVFIITVALPTISSATALSIGEPWGEFSFGTLNSFANACTGCDVSSGGNSIYLGVPPWSISGAGFLIVQDAFDIGDQFRIFDNGISIGDTSTPTGPGNCGSDPVLCFADTNVSHGIFTLGGGDHSFTIQAIASPFNGGAAFLCIDSGGGECGVGPIGGDHDIPEPDSIFLLGLSLVAAYCWAMRQRISECYIRIRSKYTRRR